MARFAAVVVALAGTAALTLSDRVPALLGAIERRTDRLVDVSVPGDPATFGHLVVWGLIALMAATLPRTPLGVVAVVVGLALASLGLEFAQTVMTTSRSAEWRDIEANLLGVTIGGAAGAAGALTRPARRFRW